MLAVVMLLTKVNIQSAAGVGFLKFFSWLILFKKDWKIGSYFACAC